LAELDRRSRTAAEELEWRALSWVPDFVDPVDAERFAATTAGFEINTAGSRVLNAEMAAWTAAEERALAAALPSAVLVQAEGTAHHPWVERPDVVRDALDRITAG
jgi:proline iminopeptidase